MFFSLCVHSRKTVVENQQRCHAHQPAGQRRALFLAAGEGYAALTQQGFEAFRKTLNGFAQGGGIR